MLLVAISFALSAAVPAVGADSIDPAALARAQALRAQVLAQSTLRPFGETGCHVGALRTFEVDSTVPRERQVPGLLAALERLIVAQGISEPINTPRGHALLSLVIDWEAGGRSPQWDVDGSDAPSAAPFPGMGGAALNPETGKCEPFQDPEPVHVILPAMIQGFTPPRQPRVPLTVGYGAEGMQRLRDQFFASKANDESAILSYSVVSATVLWGDWAVVAVNRPAEQSGVRMLKQGGGGGSYIFRFVNGEWRLLGTVRSWS